MGGRSTALAVVQVVLAGLTTPACTTEVVDYVYACDAKGHQDVPKPPDFDVRQTLVGPLCPTSAPDYQIVGRYSDGAPVTLPIVQTYEPCDGIDNDGDGITDPHCGNVPCSTDADCTYGGVLRDADCNSFQGLDPGFTRPGCNQIDGWDSDPTKSLNDCWGVLCPAGLKCVAGACITPGNKLPCEPCSSGAECPMHSGCIPGVVDEVTGEHRDPMCITYCHHDLCPFGFVCTTIQMDLNGHKSVHRICAPEGWDACPGMGDYPGDFSTQGPDRCE